MSKIIEVIAGVVLFLLMELSFTVILFKALTEMLPVNYESLWVGCCVLIGSLFVSIMIAALVGVSQKDG